MVSINSVERALKCHVSSRKFHFVVISSKTSSKKRWQAEKRYREKKHGSNSR